MKLKTKILILMKESIKRSEKQIKMGKFIEINIGMNNKEIDKLLSA